MAVNDIRTPPAKVLYTLYQVLSTAFVRLPWWILKSALPASRPRRSWTFKQALLVKIIAHTQDAFSRVKGFHFIADVEHPSTDPSDKLSWVDPAPDAVFAPQLRDWMRLAHVSPARIPGYWLHNANHDTTSIGASPAKGERVLFHAHGGGYVRMSASPREISANILRGVMAQSSRVGRAFSLEYRLSVAAPDPPVNPFPAALLDAIAGYIYLVRDVGFAPENIILSGDSAGGNLALALTRYLVEHAGTEGLPSVPGALLLLSPWVDMSDSHDQRAIDEGLFKSDYLSLPGTAVRQYSLDAFFGPLGPDGALSRYISPASADPRAESVSFEGFPRTLVVGGGAETFAPSINLFVDRMKKDIGADCSFYEAPHAIHDFLIFPFWQPEGSKTLAVIDSWIAKL